jgi:Mg2+/Co2+ transporter CorB
MPAAIHPLARLVSPLRHRLASAIAAGRHRCGLSPRPSESGGRTSRATRDVGSSKGGGEETLAATQAREEREMLQSVLDLTAVEVGQVMTHRRNVVMIDADDAPDAIVAQVLASPFSRLPIWRGTVDNVIGVIHAKALLRLVHTRGGRLDTADLLAVSTKPWFVPDTTLLLDQLRLFRRRREHFALVVDEYGTLMGIVTLEDILEEIVGEIDDEHDQPVPGVARQPDGSFIIQGTIAIRDLNREYGWHLPDAAAVTVAGLLLHEARRIPDTGQRFSFHGFRFDVLRRERNQITTIRVTPPAHGLGRTTHP